ncbi:MAG: hypothetical protein WC364_04880 [Eubacteriales bacterium]|jgi:hypothetical protein
MEDYVNAAETTAELVQRFNYADDFRQQYEDRALEWYKLYVGYRDALSEKFAGRSNLHIPRTYEEIDTLRSRIMKSFFASRPYIDFLPRPREVIDPALMEQLEAKAKIAGAIVDDQLNSVVPAFYDFVTCFLVYPAAIASVGWRYETRLTKVKQARQIQPTLLEHAAAFLQGIEPVTRTVLEEIEREVISFDDNDIQAIDFFDFWPDPRGRDIDSCRFVFHREWLTEKELRDRLALLERAGAGNIIEPPSWEALVSAGAALQDGREDRLAQIGLGSEYGQGYWKEPRKGYLMECLHYWQDDRRALLVNRLQTVFDGPNPYHRHGKKPFISTSFDPLPGEFYGISAVQIIEHLQAELNTSRNQRIDNVSMILNRMWKVRKGADINEDELVSRSHGIIWVDAPDDVTEIAFSDIPASSYNDEKVLKEDMENALGVPAVVRGVTPGRQETATEVVTKNTSAGFRFDVKVMLYEALCLKRMAYLMDCNNQQFIDRSRLVQVFGPAGLQWQQVDPGDILGEHDYAPAGSSVDPMANKELRRQQLNQVMQLAGKNPYVDMYELTRLWLQSYDIRSVDKLLKRPEEIAPQALPPGVNPQGRGVTPAGLDGSQGQGTTPEQAAMLEQILGGGTGGQG